MARLFHIFPNFQCGTKTTLLQGRLLPGVSAADLPTNWSTKIETAKAQAQAWTDFARGQFNALTTEDERTKWFGGTGTRTSSQVRTRVQESLNWISQKLAFANYVYVPDNHVITTYNYDYSAATGTSKKCTGSSSSGVLAFVLSYTTPVVTAGDFRGASYLKCGSDVPESQWLNRSCVLDSDDNLIVFMCQKWANFAEDSRTSTIVHELIHHTGPSDAAGYDSTQIQAANQTDQLDNAENYAEMVADIVDGDCEDTTGWIISSQKWDCAKFSLYSNLCADYGNSTESYLLGADGTNANVACCVCGGGTRNGNSYSADDPTPAPDATLARRRAPPVRRRAPPVRRRAPTQPRRRAPAQSPSGSDSQNSCGGTSEPSFCPDYLSYCGNPYVNMEYTVTTNGVACTKGQSITLWCPDACKAAQAAR